MIRLPRSLRKQKKSNLLLALLLVILLPLLIVQVREQQQTQQDAAETTKPNIIVIMTDDQRWDAMETLPTVTGQLANRGITFTNAYVTTPLCCPSRSSFLTGRYAHNTDVWTNHAPNGGFAGFKKHDDNTIAVWLKRAGYKTAIYGKYMNQYDNGKYVPPGWDEWYVANGSQRYWGTPISNNGEVKNLADDTYFPDIITDKAVNFIKTTKSPFFLLFATTIPHGDGSDDNEDSNNPTLPNRYKGKCDDISNWKKPPSFNEPDVTDKPQWVRKLPNQPAGESESFRKAQLCALKVVDDSVKEMLAAVGEERLQNTVFIFYSDNGYSYGEHRYKTKNCLYEECAKVPLIISYPMLTPEKRTNDSLISHIDITATIAELAGAKNPSTLDGKSLVPILKNEKDRIHDAILLEVKKQSGIKSESGSAVRYRNFKYIELATGEKELYDLRSDPYELNSLHTAPAYTTQRLQLAGLLESLRNNIDPTIQPSPLPSTSKTPTVPVTLTGNPASPSPTKKPSNTPTPYIVTATPTRTPTPTNTPTPTPTPIIKRVQAEFDVSLLLHGIGRSGDFVNPNQASLSNKNPKEKKKEFTIDLYDTADNYITSLFGTAFFDLRYGGYYGYASLDEEIPILKEYTAKVYSTNYLVKKVPGTFTISQDEYISLPEVHLVSGDVNDDNELNILDYNLIIYCYGSGKRVPATCKDHAGIIGDLNEDAVVLEQDYNLFLREIGAKKGD